MKAFRHRLEYIIVRGLDIFFSLLPISVATTLGEWFGLLASVIIFKRRKMVLDNLAQALPEKSLAERKRIASGSWRNLGRTAAEFVRLPSLVRDVYPTVRWEGAEHVEKAMREKKGVIMLTAHFTNWEMLGALVRIRFGPFMAIARPIKNPLVDAWVHGKRTACDLTIILHRQAVRASLKWIKQQNTLGVLVDQNLYTGGDFVNFFGRPAATTTLPAILHARTGAPVLVAYCLREAGTFHVVIEPPLHFPKIANDEERLRIHTQIVSDRLEKFIRRNPENWMWVHNRWKRKQ